MTAKRGVIGHLSRTGFPGTGRKGKKTRSPTIERGGSAGSRFQTPGRESNFKGNSYGAAGGDASGESFAKFPSPTRTKWQGSMFRGKVRRKPAGPAGRDGRSFLSRFLAGSERICGRGSGTLAVGRTGSVAPPARVFSRRAGSGAFTGRLRHGRIRPAGEKL